MTMIQYTQLWDYHTFKAKPFYKFIDRLFLLDLLDLSSQIRMDSWYIIFSIVYKESVLARIRFS